MTRSAGFSLLELVVVLSIFALVALIGVQVIQATVRSSTRLTEVSERNGELALALALLRQDLNAGLARSFEPASGGRDPALKVGPGAQFSLTVGGLARMQSDASGLGRVTWRFDAANGGLYRQVQTSLTPGASRAAEVLIASGVQRFEVSSFEAQSGWKPGFAVDPRNPARLPLGLKLRMDHARVEGLETVVSLR